MEKKQLSVPESQICADLNQGKFPSLSEYVTDNVLFSGLNSGLLNATAVLPS